jgi:hypothetical protein
MINGALSDAHHTLRSDAENSIVPTCMFHFSQYVILVSVS